MIVGLDHIVVLVHDLDVAVAAYRNLLGREPSWRAENDAVATGIFTVGNMSLELMAAKGRGAAGDVVRAAIDKQGEGLASLTFAVDGLPQIHRRLKRLGCAPEDIKQGESRDLLGGKTISWTRTRVSREASHGVRLFFLQLNEPRPASTSNADAPVLALDHVVIATPNPDRAAALYGARLGLDMALDRTNEAWGVRLMFFRCGDLVLEIVHRLKDAIGDSPDKLWGLSWRVADIEASHARLHGGGFAVSDVRDGRKPGTRVFTVKSGTCGVPTLVIQQTAGAS